MKVGFWMTPVVYPLKMIPEQYQFIMFANPVARSLFDIRDVLIYDTIPQWTFTALTVIISIAIFVLGIYVFTKRMHKFAEEV
jgi:lipopolysaccharide transport system permease protein